MMYLHQLAYYFKYASPLLAIIFLGGCEQISQIGPDDEASFVKYFAGEYSLSAESAVEKSDADGFLILGTSRFSAAGEDSDLILISTDELGNTDRPIERIDDQQLDQSACQMLKNQAGYLIIANSQNADGQSDGLLIQLDGNLSERWRRSIGSPEHSEHINRAIELADGSIVILGYSTNLDMQKNGYLNQDPQNIPGIEHDSSDLWIMKLSSDGEEEWEKVFGFRGADQLNDLAFLNGNLYVLGTSNFPEGTIFQPDPVRDRDLILAKLDLDGNIFELAKIGEFNSNETAVALGITSINQLMVMATEQLLDQDNVNTLLIRVDQNLRLIDQQKIGGSQPDIGRSMIHTADQGFLIAGSSRSISNGESDIWLVKASENGTLNWQKHFGSIGQDEGAEAFIASDQAIIVVGTIATSFETETQISLIKTNPLGEFVQ
ncbi:MAG: hypothetical protein AAF206_25485 [Bacteroidota bacterium]